MAADVTGQPDRPRFLDVKGVYTPSLLTILGVVMYLRFGWVLGNLGLFRPSVVTLSTSITFLTALSIGHRDQHARGRRQRLLHDLAILGLEVGAAIGLPLSSRKRWGSRSTSQASPSR